MRLLALFPQLRSLLTVPFLAVMLVFPATAEPNPSAAPSDPSASQAESTPDAAPTGPNSGPAEQKPEATSPDSSTAETKPEDPGTTGEAKPEGTEPSDDAAAAEQPKSSILVNIDKATQEMTVFVDGVELYTWPVSTGLRGYSTPSGTYTTTSMNEIWYSKQWDNAPMPHAIFFTKKGHAIHGTLEEKRLGNAASHGCVRLSRENAATLYALVAKTGLKNTQVVLAGLTAGGEGKVATLSRSKSSRSDSFSQRPRRGGLFRRLFGSR